MFRNQATGDEEFVILRPFVPFSTNDTRTELQAYLTASSDPETYGQLVSYVVDQEDAAGRARCGSPTRPSRSRRSAATLTLLANEETKTSVRFGDLQLVPVGDGLLYVRPVYVVVQRRHRVPVRDRVDRQQRRLRHSTSRVLWRACSPASTGSIGDRIADGDEPVDEDGETPELPAAGTTARQLLDEAEALFAEADTLLRDGDLGGYQATIDRAKQKVADAIAAMDESDTAG